MITPPGQSRDEYELARAWETAATDLDIRVTHPFVLRSATAQDHFTFIALVHGFGSPAGTLLVTTAEESTPLAHAARSAGYFASLLNPDAYRRYDRELFIETLNDWGYFGSEHPPSWYTGAPSTP